MMMMMMMMMILMIAKTNEWVCPARWNVPCDDDDDDDDINDSKDQWMGLSCSMECSLWTLSVSYGGGTYGADAEKEIKHTKN